MVAKGEEQEQNLYSKVRNAEYSRQKQEQSVRHLQQQLQEVRRKNAAKVKEEIATRNRQEMELQQALIREKAELDKVMYMYTLELHMARILVVLSTVKFLTLAFESHCWCLLVFASGFGGRCSLAHT